MNKLDYDSKKLLPDFIEHADTIYKINQDSTQLIHTTETIGVTYYNFYQTENLNIIKMCREDDNEYISLVWISNSIELQHYLSKENLELKDLPNFQFPTL
jgi:hypothetical protein